MSALQRDGERLVTVWGRGGAGKTSLALAAANELIDDYEGGSDTVFMADSSAEPKLPPAKYLIAAPPPQKHKSRPPSRAGSFVASWSVRRVWWVEASQEHHAEGLWDLIARACRIDVGGSAQEAVVTDLRSRSSLLLFLDNLEGIPDASIVVDSLLARLPQLSVLAT